MFTRSISTLTTYELLPGETSLDFIGMGGNSTDPFLYFRLSMLNPSQAGTFDFETEEVSGVGTIKYLFDSGVTAKHEITDVITTSPILIMQDLTPPVAYLYIDDTDVEVFDESHHTKSGKQEVNYNSELRLPAIQVEEDGVALEEFVLGGVARYAIKGNWHFFSRSILCDTVSIFVRKRVQDGLFLEVFNFL